jgi:dUTP pyrophosphatase
MKQLRFKKLHPDVIIPTRANPIDAGLDLYALEDVVIPPTMTGLEGRVMGNMERGFLPYLPTEIGQAKIKTGLAVEIPQGYYGKISSRSGLAFKSGIVAFDGTIDAAYRGEIGVLLYNTTDKPYQIRKGDRIAQLIILPCALLDPIEADELSTADRGEKGFGSTGR